MGTPLGDASDVICDGTAADHPLRSSESSACFVMEIVLPPTPQKDHILLRKDSRKQREAAYKSSTRRLYDGYSRSLINPALQLLQKSSKSASTTPQRPIWNDFGTVAVRDFWENGCRLQLEVKRKGAPVDVVSFLVVMRRSCRCKVLQSTAKRMSCTKFFVENMP